MELYSLGTEELDPEGDGVTTGVDLDSAGRGEADLVSEGREEVDLGSAGRDEADLAEGRCEDDLISEEDSSINEVTRFNDGVTHCEGRVLSSE